MRRAFVLVVAAAFAIACRTGGDDVAFTTVGSASSSGAVSSSGTTATPPYRDPSIGACVGNELTSCGQNGCCAPGYLCLSNACVAPGLACEKDVDCTGGRYCEPTLGHCLPTPTVCPAVDAGTLDEGCLDPSCAPDATGLLITGILHTPSCGCESTAPVQSLGVRVQNRGHKTAPAGVKVLFWADADAGANDAGITTGETHEALVPGQATDVYVPFSTCDWYMTIVREPEDCFVTREPHREGTHCQGRASR